MFSFAKLPLSLFIAGFDSVGFTNQFTDVQYKLLNQKYYICKLRKTKVFSSECIHVQLLREESDMFIDNILVDASFEEQMEKLMPFAEKEILDGK